MKTFSQIQNLSKTPVVISILGSEVPSLTEEVVLRTANRISKEREIEHVALVLKSQVSESEILQKYIKKFSDSFQYIESLSEAKLVSDSFNSHVVCEESVAHLFFKPIVVESRKFPIMESAINGDFNSFKKYAFNDLRDIDCKYLFNLVRESKNLEEIQEKIELPKDLLRERFFKGEIFNVGDTVEHKGEICEILDRGSNYLVVVNSSGVVRKSWVADLLESHESIHWKPLNSGEELSYKGYDTKNFHKIDEGTRNEFVSIVEQNNDPLLVLKTIKLMDQFIDGGDDNIKKSLAENISKLQEDVMSADFKIGEDGRRIRARRVYFKNKVNGKVDSSEKDDEEVKEELNTKLEYHETLNKKLWDEEDNLIPEVRNKLVQIADAFESFIDKDGKIFNVVDVIITGSNCNFNYTPQSDIDLHLIVDLDDIEDKELVGAFLTAKKTLWKDQHDIKIKGYDVELYAQDKNDNLVATGMYSIRKNKWIEKPQHLELKIDNFSVQTKACDIINQIDHILSGHATVEQIDSVKEKIRKMRQSGLSKGGEFSVENLAFKAIRNNGYFEKLNNLKKEITDKKLSLENFVVMDKNRTDNGSRGILSAEDLHNLIKKMKVGHTLTNREDLRTRKVKYATE